MNGLYRQCDDLEEHLKRTQEVWKASLDVWADSTRQRFGEEYWYPSEFHLKKLIAAGRELSSTLEFVKSKL